MSGIFLVMLAAAGIIFFRYYKGELIPYPWLWFIGFVLIGLTGLLFIYSGAVYARQLGETYIKDAATKVKMSMEEISIDFDKCSFRNGTYYQETDDPSMSGIKTISESVAGLHVDTTITETVSQSWLVYTDTVNGISATFISPAFPLEEVTLKMYVLEGRIKLYVDKQHPDKYFFELTST